MKGWEMRRGTHQHVCGVVWRGVAWRGSHGVVLRGVAWCGGTGQDEPQDRTELDVVGWGSMRGGTGWAA